MYIALKNPAQAKNQLDKLEEMVNGGAKKSVAMPAMGMELKFDVVYLNTH